MSTTRHISINCCQSRLLGAKRETSRAQTRAHLAEADLGYHPFEPGALHAAGRRAAEIVVDHFDLGKAQRRQPVSHGVLQRPAFAIVQHLVRRRLAHVEDRLALKMMRTDFVSDHGRPPPWSASPAACA